MQRNFRYQNQKIEESIEVFVPFSRRRTFRKVSNRSISISEYYKYLRGFFLFFWFKLINRICVKRLLYFVSNC